ncbi:MAG: hypothetical protein ACRDT0_27265 [Pseudonocardiaceae bacterium]
MRSHTTREFLAGVAIAQQFGPHTPAEQAWIPDPVRPRQGRLATPGAHPRPGELDRELDRVHTEYNTVRPHASIAYVTPDDEHEGRGEGIRQARRDGLAQARAARINYRQTTLEDNR